MIEITFDLQKILLDNILLVLTVLFILGLVIKDAIKKRRENKNMEELEKKAYMARMREIQQAINELRNEEGKKTSEIYNEFRNKEKELVEEYEQIRKKLN